MISFWKLRTFLNSVIGNGILAFFNLNENFRDMCKLNILGGFLSFSRHCVFILWKT